MALYAVAERRLRPGAWHAYIEAMRAVDAYLKSDIARGPYSLYVDQDDPDVVVGIGLWRERADLAAATRALPKPLTEALAAAVAEGEGDWQWFRSVRQRRAFTGSVALVAAARFSVADADLPAFGIWAAQAQERAIRLGGVLTQHLLVSEDDPGTFIHLAEYVDHTARHAALGDLDAHPSPVPMIGLRRSIGRIGHYWAREEALGEGSAS